jgi:hypothetical protein
MGMGENSKSGYLHCTKWFVTLGGCAVPIGHQENIDFLYVSYSILF